MMRQFAVTLSCLRAVGHRLDMLDQSASGQVRRVGPDVQERFSVGRQLGVDRRDLREQLLDLLAVVQLPAHHPGLTRARAG